MGPRFVLSAAALVAALATLPRPAAAQEKWYDRLTLSGDFRVRSESFFQEGTPDRTRARIRLRFGVTAPLGDGFTAGLRFATGERGNITSTNVSLGDVFENKAFNLDRAFLAWRPNGTVEITAGKFGLPRWRPSGAIVSELLFDDDLSPEGFHETLTLHSARTGTVRRVALMGEQWVLRESGSGTDSWMVGGQGVVELAVDGRTSLGVGAGYYEFLNGRTLVQARNDNDALLVTNAVRTRSGALVGGGLPLRPAAADPFDRFEQQFQLVHAGAGLRRSGVAGTDLEAYVEWVRNAGADEHRTGVWAGVSLGTARNPGDWAAGLAWARVEQEAVLSMLSYSDLGRGGTNVEGPIVAVSWRPARAITLQAKDHIMTPVREVPGLNARVLHRLQLDARVSF